ncbi:MAG: glycosyltransferase [Caldilineaceae bacterium]|nr:glycosyltransferase [Caldilineaceae bacterium]
MPRVSVIIPTYNRAELLGDAIASVLAQEYQDFEVIVADDGSTDQSAEVVKRFGPRVIHLALPHRGQPAAPRNAALAVAAGDYIAFLDSDDLFLPHKLALQVPILEANPQIGLVYSDGYFFAGDPDKMTGHALAGLATPSGNVFGELLRANFIFMPLILVRRTLLEASGGFDEHPDLLVAEDYDLWLRLALQTSFQYVPGDVAAIRLHPGNISANTLRIRQRILGILQRLDAQRPALMAQYALARHEAYAINHGAIAQEALRQRHTGLAMHHLGRALWHTAQLPGFGLAFLRAWKNRRRLRLGEG